MKEPTLGSPQNTIAVLQKYNFVFQKKFGQNFLIDTHVLDKIIRSAEITKEDFVLEIGPGIGTMTQYLACAAGKVVAVEIDRALIPILADTLDGYDNVTVINEDVLKVDIAKLAEEQNGGRPIKVVANLPYYITTPIIMGLFEKNVPIKSITVMVQKEVADRLASPPGNKAYGILSVLLQAWYDIEYLFSVEPGSFTPPPKVRSAVIRIRRNDRTALGCDETIFKRVVKTCFNMRRKTIRNSIKPMLGDYTLTDTASTLLDMRPEQLSVEMFVELTKLLKTNTKAN